MLCLFHVANEKRFAHSDCNLCNFGPKIQSLFNTPYCCLVKTCAL